MLVLEVWTRVEGLVQACKLKAWVAAEVRMMARMVVIRAIVAKVAWVWAVVKVAVVAMVLMVALLLTYGADRKQVMSEMLA